MATDKARDCGSVTVAKLRRYLEIHEFAGDRARGPEAEQHHLVCGVLRSLIAEATESGSHAEPVGWVMRSDLDDESAITTRMFRRGTGIDDHEEWEIPVYLHPPKATECRSNGQAEPDTLRDHLTAALVLASKAMEPNVIDCIGNAIGILDGDPEVISATEQESVGRQIDGVLLRSVRHEVDRAKHLGEAQVLITTDAAEHLLRHTEEKSNAEGGSDD